MADLAETMAAIDAHFERVPQDIAAFQHMCEWLELHGAVMIEARMIGGRMVLVAGDDLLRAMQDFGIGA